MSCFNLDIIFLIYLYQRWIYRVDPKRVNEFGTSGEMMEDHKEDQDESQAAPPPALTSGTENQNGAAVHDAGAESSPSKNNSSSHPNKSKNAKKRDWPLTLIAMVIVWLSP